MVADAVKMLRGLVFGWCLLATPAIADLQEVDDAYSPAVASPRYRLGTGPTICIDSGHDNFHTLEGRFRPLGMLLRADGYVATKVDSILDVSTLARCRLLIIANARPKEGSFDASRFPMPSAFSDAEILAIHSWVATGGAFLFIADHMPFPGAAAKLGEAFGFEFNDGYAVENFTTEDEARAAFAMPMQFVIDDGTLLPHAMLNGGAASERVTKVTSFMGQAFRAPAGADALLRLPPNFISMMPDIPEQFALTNRRVPVGGWLQGAVVKVGGGRTAVFGDAGMFTAQLRKTRDGKAPLGFNSPLAEQNQRFILNLMAWLLPDAQIESEKKQK